MLHIKGCANTQTSKRCKRTGQNLCLCRRRKEVLAGLQGFTDWFEYSQLSLSRTLTSQSTYPLIQPNFNDTNTFETMKDVRDRGSSSY